MFMALGERLRSVAGILEFVDVTCYALTFSSVEILYHSGQNIGSIIVTIPADLSITFDCLRELGPAFLPVRWKVDEVLHLCRVREYADHLVQTLLKGGEIHPHCNRGLLQSDIPFNIAREATTTIIAFYLD